MLMWSAQRDSVWADHQLYISELMARIVSRTNNFFRVHTAIQSPLHRGDWAIFFVTSPTLLSVPSFPRESFTRLHKTNRLLPITGAVGNGFRNAAGRNLYGLCEHGRRCSVSGRMILYGASADIYQDFEFLGRLISANLAITSGLFLPVPLPYRERPAAPGGPCWR